MTVLAAHPQALVTPRAGQTWLQHGRHEVVRVMGVVEGSVVFRKRGAAPWLETIRAFNRDFTRCT